MSRTVLAFDFGASSGRAISAAFDGKSLTCREVHRFENVPLQKDGHLRWDFDSLLREVHTGIAAAGRFDSVAFDTWGVDFGLLDGSGHLLESPVHYRDSRTDGMPERAFAVLPPDRLYAATGNQIMSINTLFQLMASDLTEARTLLFMPDLFAHALCGRAVCETTIAATSQMLNPATKKWSGTVLDSFGIPAALFAERVATGTVIGEYQSAKVIAAAGHDTQCAVAALPATAADAAFLSCGTWSLLGVELDAPILTEESRLLGLSNEVGANGRVNYLKNIIGLWLIQESRREWRRQGQEYSYAELERLALAAKPFQCFIDPDAPEFAPPGDLPGRVREFCRKTGQPQPETVGEIMRCIYESLALKYRAALEQLEQSSRKSFGVLHVLGGGAKDRLLCQMTANCCDIPVIAGPIEATALGNIILQLSALGELSCVEAGRALIRKTEVLTEYKPREQSVWNTAYQNYRKIVL